MNCDDCLHYRDCFERRGPCREYKTLKGIQREIEELNENYQKIARHTKTSHETTASGGCCGRRQVHESFGTPGKSDAPDPGKMGKVKAKREKDTSGPTNDA